MVFFDIFLQERRIVKLIINLKREKISFNFNYEDTHKIFLPKLYKKRNKQERLKPK
jgi:hypothetical protein